MAAAIGASLPVEKRAVRWLWISVVALLKLPDLAERLWFTPNVRVGEPSRRSHHYLRAPQHGSR
jgi:hypothetical protein